MKKNKKLILRIAAVFVTFASIYLFAPWQFGLYYFSPLPVTAREQVEEAAAQGINGIILYVDRKGKPPRLYTSGWHDRDAKIKAYPTALFKIGSIRKLYDAVAFSKLVAAGLLSPEDTLADHLPALKGRIDHAEHITLRMMIGHRSGIPNFTDQDGFNWGETLSREDALALVLDQPASFAPDSDYGYSNTNYLLLRRIMSKVLGYDHWQYIKAEILTPLGLEHTYRSVQGVNIADVMGGYHIGYDQNFKTLDQGFVATAEDVGRFLRALNEGTVFKAGEREIYVSLYNLGHTGWVLGHSSRAHYHQDIDTVVVQFVNTTGNDTVMLTGIIYNRILKILSREHGG